MTFAYSLMTDEMNPNLSAPQDKILGSASTKCGISNQVVPTPRSDIAAALEKPFMSRSETLTKLGSAAVFSLRL